MTSLRANEESVAIYTGSPRRYAPRDDDLGRSAPRDDDRGWYDWDQLRG